MIHLLLGLAICAALLLLCGLIYQRRLARVAAKSARRSIREREALLRLMDTIGERMTRGFDLNETLEVIAKYVVEAAGAESGAIYLLDEAGETLDARVVVGHFPALFENEPPVSGAGERTLAIRNRRIRAGEGIVGAALEAENPILIENALTDSRLPPQESATVPARSLMLSALRARGKSLGVLAVANKRGEKAFDSRDTSLLHTLADQAAVTVDLVKLYDVLARQQKLEHQLMAAREFQMQLLPRSCPQIEGYEFAALNQPALMVGGDFYDFFFVDRNHLGIVVADVSGKGLPAALVMVGARSSLRAEARDTLAPREVLRRVNERLLAETREGVFVTISYAILDIPNQRLRFARGGHEPTLLRDATENPKVTALNPEGVAVGLFPGEIFERTEEVEIQLKPGEMALLYTDGAVEALNGRSQEYGRKRLTEVLEREGRKTPVELLDAISEDIEQFSRGIPQHDDITMVAFRVKPEEVEPAPEISGSD